MIWAHTEPISSCALTTPNGIPGNFANPEKVFADGSTGNKWHCRTAMKVEPGGCSEICAPPRATPEKRVALFLLSGCSEDEMGPWELSALGDRHTEMLLKHDTWICP